MAERSQFWTTNATGDGSAYTQSQTAEFFKAIYGNNDGVMRGVNNELAVSGTSSPIALATGAAVVQGFFYINDASKNITVATPVVGTTGHRLVLQVDWTAQTVRAVLKSSSDGVSAIPALTQTVGTTYEISLATLIVTTGGVISLTDTRTFTQFGTNHVKRDGDTMTGLLTLARSTGGTYGNHLLVSSPDPNIILQDTDAATNNKNWAIISSSEGLYIQAVNDALNATGTALRVDRTNTTIDKVDLQATNVNAECTLLTRNGYTVWDSNNFINSFIYPFFVYPVTISSSSYTSYLYNAGTLILNTGLFSSECDAKLIVMGNLGLSSNTVTFRIINKDTSAVIYEGSANGTGDFAFSSSDIRSSLVNGLTTYEFQAKSTYSAHISKTYLLVESY